MSVELFESIKSGDVAKVTRLVDGDTGLANAVNEQGASAHTFAIYNRKTDIAQLLEDRGARIDIFAVAMSGRLKEVCEMLDGNGKKIIVVWGETGLGKSSLLAELATVR